MAEYNYADDGKIHTRFSELIRCTPGQIDRVLAERAGRRSRVETDSMAEGIERHLMFEEQVKQSMQIPPQFNVSWPVSHVEQEFSSELLPGIVVHSRVDLLCAEAGIIPDFKTVLDGVNGWQKNLKGYHNMSKQRQLRFYAFQAGLHGFRIKRGVFLCEIWNNQRDTILGYQKVEFAITLTEMASVVDWVKRRCALLASALEAEQIAP